MSLVRSYLFRPEQRIRNSAGFQVVFDSTLCKVAVPQYLVLIRANTESKARIGFVIARKKVRFAVERNRIKRVVKNSFRQVMPLLNLPILFSAKRVCCMSMRACFPVLQL